MTATTALYLQAPFGIEQNSKQIGRLKEFLTEKSVQAFLSHNIHLIEHLLMENDQIANDVALMLNHAPDMDVKSVKNSLGGYHLFQATVPTVKSLRKENKNLSLGAGPIGDKHEAMEIAEAGADYIAFPVAETELIKWWVESFEVPAVAWGCSSVDQARELIDMKVEFIMPSPQMWLQDNALEDLIKLL